MSEAEWKVLFYTWDCSGDFMRLGKHGPIFPNNVEDKIFDVKMPDGTVFEKCLVISMDGGVTATTILTNGNTLQLEDQTQLKANPDKEIEKKLTKVYIQLLAEKRCEDRIKGLKTEKEQLLKSLARVNKELEKLENKNTKTAP